MILGILQTGHLPNEVARHSGDYTTLYGAMFPGRDYRIRTFSVVDGIFPDSPDEADAWLITGSRAGAYEDHDWIAPLEALIRDIRDSGRPLVGICFGHQIIAQALGGTVEKFTGGWSVGRTVYDIAGTRLALNAWHQDQVTALPEGAIRLGASETCANAVLAFGEHILTLQPHPEFTDLEVGNLIAHRTDGIVPPDRVTQAREGLGGSNDNRAIHDWLADVLEGAPATRVPFASNASTKASA